MKKTRKILGSILLIIVMVMTLSIPTMAVEPKQETSIEVPVITVDENLSEAQIANIISNSASKSINDATVNSTPTVVSALITRSGDTETCSVFLHWAGTDLYNAWRFKSLTIRDTSFLFPKTYATFGDGITYTAYYTGASSIGTVLIGNARIPIDVDQVKVNSYGLQGYNLNSASWLSGVEFTGTVTIN